MKKAVIIIALLAMPAICIAELYQWVDEKGNVGYADDLGNVPAKYRKKAKIIGGQEPAVEVIEKGDESVESSRGAEPKKDDHAATGEQKATDKTQKLYGGKTADAWKRDFARRKHEVTSLEEQASDLKERMANPGSMSRGEYVTLQNTERNLQFRIDAAKEKLQSLTEEADQAEVPEDLR